MIPIELKSERFIIRPYNRSDEDRYIEMVLDEISNEFMGGATGIESKEREVFKKIFSVYENENERIFWIWGIYKDDILYGHLELKETEHTIENELEIVYMVHPQCRNIGVMTEILYLIKQNSNFLGKTLIATVSADNTVSIKMLEKLGIVRKEIIVDEDSKDEFLKLVLSV